MAILFASLESVINSDVKTLELARLLDMVLTLGTALCHRDLYMAIILDVVRPMESFVMDRSVAPPTPTACIEVLFQSRSKCNQAIASTGAWEKTNPKGHCTVQPSDTLFKSVALEFLRITLEESHRIFTLQPLVVPPLDLSAWCCKVWSPKRNHDPCLQKKPMKGTMPHAYKKDPTHWRSHASALQKQPIKGTMPHPYQKNQPIKGTMPHPYTPPPL